MSTPTLDHILATLRPGFLILQSPHLTEDQQHRCRWCNAQVWRCTTQLGKDILLNPEPDIWGRYVIEPNGIAIFCEGRCLATWPLPRYSSHFLDCPALIVERERQRLEAEEEAKGLRAWRKEQKQKQKERKETFFRRFDE